MNKITNFLLIILLFLFFVSCDKSYDKLQSADKVKIFENDFKYERKYRANIDTTSQKILLIGDSMAHFLEYRLNDYCEENNHLFYVVSWVSGTTEVFANTDTITYFIDKYDPTYIIFVIGSNEMFVKNPNERSDFVYKIVEKFGKLKNIWVGPPNWKADTGINEMLVSTLGSKKFFMSKTLKFERKSSGDVHPSHKSSAMWMDSIASWIVNKSDFPIILNYPNVKSKKEIIETLITSD